MNVMLESLRHRVAVLERGSRVEEEWGNHVALTLDRLLDRIQDLEERIGLTQ